MAGARQIIVLGFVNNLADVQYAISDTSGPKTGVGDMLYNMFLCFLMMGMQI